MIFHHNPLFGMIERLNNFSWPEYMFSRALNEKLFKLDWDADSSHFFKPVTATWCMMDQQWIWALSLDSTRLKQKQNKQT